MKKINETWHEFSKRIAGDVKDEDFNPSKMRNERVKTMIHKLNKLLRTGKRNVSDK
jgi:hypothetical protein